MAFKASHSVTQGGPLSAKLFNISVDAVMREWVWQLEEDGDYEKSLQSSTSAVRPLFNLGAA